MSINFLVPFLLLAYGIILSAITLYGLKLKANWVCTLVPSDHCKELDRKKYAYTMKNYNVVIVLIILLLMFYLNFQCFTDAVPYYAFFMISALLLIVSFFYTGMQLFVMNTRSYWVINLVLIAFAIFIFSIRQLIHLQPPV